MRLDTFKLTIFNKVVLCSFGPSCRSKFLVRQCRSTLVETPVWFQSRIDERESLSLWIYSRIFDLPGILLGDLLSGA